MITIIKNIHKINSHRVRIADIEGNEAEEIINPDQCHAVLQLALPLFAFLHSFNSICSLHLSLSAVCTLKKTAI